MIADGAERQVFATRADWDPIWVTRRGEPDDDAARLQAALDAAGPLPAGDGYIWIAGEAQLARRLRTYVTMVLGHPTAWVKAAGYWMIGQADAHVRIED